MSLTETPGGSGRQTHRDLRHVQMWWKASEGAEPLEIDFPDGWCIRRIGLNAPSPMSDEEIAAAIRHPVAGPPLAERVRGCKDVCIAVDDLTKPTEAWRTAPIVLEELQRGGIDPDDVFFVVSLGTHRALPLQDFRRKLGPTLPMRHRIYNHSPYQNVRSIGHTSRGLPIEVNSFFLDAGYRIAIGMLMPHNLAGFSGGGKMVMPGLASLNAVEANHRSTLKGLAGRIGVLEGNQVRADIDEAAARAGLNFIVNSVHGEDGATVKLFAGDPAETYRLAVAQAQQIYACDVTYGEDVGVFNAFPRDNWFLLSLSSLDVWSSRDDGRAIVRRGGTIVIVNHCTEGAGEHGLHTKGMKHYVMRDEHGTFRQMLEARDLIVLSPNLHAGIVRDYYRKPVAVCSTWAEVRTLLERKHGASATVSVFPCGTLQMDRAVLPS